MYEILREINEELARVNAGIVVWKIIPKEETGKNQRIVCFPALCLDCGMGRRWGMSPAMPLMTITLWHISGWLAIRPAWSHYG